MATKLWRMVTYLHALLAIKSHDHFITWSCPITWQTKTNISPSPLCLWPPNMVGWWFTSRGCKSGSHITLLSRDLERSSYKQKPLYLYYQSAYGRQSWQDGNLTWQAPTYKVTWPFDHMVLQGHETNKNHFMFTTIVPLATKLGTMITYLDRFLPLKSHDSLITWSYEITWQTETIISPIPQCLWLQNFVGWWLNLSGSHP